MLLHRFARNPAPTRSPSVAPTLLLLAVAAAALTAPLARAADPTADEYLRAFRDAVRSSPSRVPAVLRSYEKLEGRQAFDLETRYRMHEMLREEIGKLDSRAMTRIVEREIDRSPSRHLPGVVLMLKVLIHGAHRIERAERIEHLVRKARDTDEPRISQWAVRLLGDAGGADAIDALIDILDREEAERRAGSVLWHQASAELYRSLGSVAVGTAPTVRARWRAMGRKVPKEPDHSLPADDAENAGATVFFGDRISPRSVFCIDTSSSMRQPARIRSTRGRAAPTSGDDGEPRGEDSREPKIDVVKRELERALSTLLPEFRFNVLAYSATWRAWRGGPKEGVELVDADEAALASATQYARELETFTGTNIHDTLERALAVSGVDTIYLLSDGEPSRGGGKKEIEATVRRGNYLLGARIVAYGIVPEEGGSLDEGFLRSLSGEHRGWYRRLNDAGGGDEAEKDDDDGGRGRRPRFRSLER